MSTPGFEREGPHFCLRREKTSPPRDQAECFRSSSARLPEHRDHRARPDNIQSAFIPRHQQRMPVLAGIPSATRAGEPVGSKDEPWDPAGRALSR